VKGKIAKLLEAAREKVKPTMPRLIFDGRKGNDERKREFDEYMREREGELRAS
jgi:5'-3' exonuclease